MITRTNLVIPSTPPSYCAIAKSPPRQTRIVLKVPQPLPVPENVNATHTSEAPTGQQPAINMEPPQEPSTALHEVRRPLLWHPRSLTVSLGCSHRCQFAQTPSSLGAPCLCQ